MREKVIYDSPCFLTLVGSKANSFNNNHYDQWIVLVATNWIGNWILLQYEIDICQFLCL